MSDRWPNLQDLIDCGGVINIGHINAMSGTAIAMQERQVYAMLRIDDESLPDVPDLLDAAVAKAVEDDIFTDEING